MELVQLPSPAAWTRALLDRWRAILQGALDARGACTVCLAGGATPALFYQALARQPAPWERVFWFFGDERNVPPDHPDSNFRMARAALLDPIAAPPANIARWQTELPPDAAAAAYETALRRHLDSGHAIDWMLLGIGADGHTASLFPGTPALAETFRLAAANPVPQLDTIRLTLTYPALALAGEITFLTAGAAKLPVIREVLATHSSHPASRARCRGPVRILHLADPNA